MRAVDEAEPINAWFSLSYANYLVLQRSLLEAMPGAWQRKLVALLEQFWETFDADQVPTEFEVRRRGADGRYLPDPFSAYRHVDPRMIEAARRRRSR